MDDDGAGSYQALNDTGVVDCATVGAARLACPQAGYPVQDGETGRDVTDNDSGDGLAGFSFTKLDSDGVALPKTKLAFSAFALILATRRAWYFGV